VTLGLLTISVGIYYLPGVTPVLVYERRSVLSGELWRLFSGHLVHFSASHLLYNALALGLAGWIIEYRRYPRYVIVCVFSALLVSLAILTVKPDMTVYGGLSGIASASIVYFSLCAIREAGPWRWIGGGTLLLTIVKIFFESMSDKPLFASIDTISFLPVPMAHVMGGMTACVIFFTSGIALRGET
jgi:rhomboid family GlyGly-CTERM serine protease